MCSISYSSWEVEEAAISKQNQALRSDCLSRLKAGRHVMLCRSNLLASLVVLLIVDIDCGLVAF